jgi:hypothetical protein
VDPDADPPAVLPPRRDGVVEVARVVGIDGERGQVSEVYARARRVRLVQRDLGLGAGRTRIAAAQAAVEHESFDHVARAVGTADPAQHARAALAAANQNEVAGPGVAPLNRRPRTRTEDRLGHQEAPALLEHGHHRLVQPAGRPAAHG